MFTTTGSSSPRRSMVALPSTYEMCAGSAAGPWA
jgi:hypothetical protein